MGVQHAFDVREGGGAVDMGFTVAQQVQIGAIDEEDILGCHCGNF